MPRITPSSAVAIDLGPLEDHEPYRATLNAIDWSTGSAEYGGEQRLQLDWLLEDGETNLRDWIGLRLGKQKAGGVSKLRSLLNALSEKPADAEVAYFDTETLEWGYDETAVPFNKLVLGMEVILRGQKGLRSDGVTGKFTVNVYQPVKKVAAKRTLAPIPEDEVPF